MTSSIPNHVAIIMDGNGRWAKQKGFARSKGHGEGARRVDEITYACLDLGIRYLTVYAFSTENWKRPRTEVQMLMRLLVQFLGSLDRKLLRTRVTIRAQGDLGKLPDFVRRELLRVMRVSEREDPSLVLTLCLSYGGRKEIVDATRSIAAKVKSGEIDPESIDENLFSKHLYQPTHPDPDLLIRTGGEFRVSNFLLWEIAYSELYITETLWPDFGKAALIDAVASFQRRERRFGMVSDQVKKGATVETTRP